ncbi:FtsB family cell division protein [Roseospira navarrensis]|uniref:Septum formation initiator family protein n=1 Tax=Roseospira navarrensis TaxID=140058 RepID=A0A7X2D361_9PROT|nr:septum formation initiator family protein [Roseospira navarrensis]MQX35242.1 septum formation initiator family protein [Roseospira navarrensis]
MSSSAPQRRRIQSIAVPLLGVAVLSYFGYHAIQGERGLIRWWQLRQDIRVAMDMREDLAAQREVLERRVRLLKPEHLHPDMLDERARVMLNLVGPDEVVILPPGE